MRFLRNHTWPSALLFLCLAGLLVAPAVFAGEADIVLPDLSQVKFTILGGTIGGISIMYFGLLVCIIGLIFGLIQSNQTKNLPAHKSMLDVSDIIWETC